jgi:hypothetical protein
VRSRLLKTTILVAAAGAMWTHIAQLKWPLTIRRRLSLKCLLLGHEDWIRRTSDRLYLECFECGRETQGWTTGVHHQIERAGGRRREPRRSESSFGDHRDLTIAA